jgi:hypothetical protein
MRKAPTIHRGTSARAVQHWFINLIWIIVWTVLYFLCINVFGNTVAFIGIPTLIVIMVIIWLATERRDRQPPEKVS